jgi:tetratricopeptide (TPR) repeat protein
MEQKGPTQPADALSAAVCEITTLLDTNPPAAELSKAEARLSELLKVHPADASAHRLLASLCLRLDRYEEAERQLVRALELSPDFSMARWMLAVTLNQRTNWDQALPHVEMLLKEEPENSDYLGLKAHLLLNLGEYEGAVACYETLLTKSATPENWMFYGNALKAVGRQQDSIAAYRNAIALKPDFGQAYWALADLKTFRFTPAEIDTMGEVLARADLNPRSRAQMHFALGKALEDAKQYARSFEQYRSGNAVWRREVRHSADGVATFVRQCKALFTSEFFASRAGAGASAPDPIFIVGLPRSGSTLIEQILSSHSEVEGTRELTALNSVAMQLAGHERTRDSRYPEILRDLNGQQLRSSGDDYIARTRAHRKLDRPFFIDKLPSNFLHLGLLHLILPKARIVDARRHPLGCGFANFKQYFPYGQSFAFDLTEIGRYYRDYVELMAHFDAVLPGRVHRVFYERMVTDPEQEVRRLLDHCGLPFEEGCLRFYETKRSIFTPSAEQVRQPIFADAMELWRHYEPWLGPLKSALGNALEAYPGVPKFDAHAQIFGAQWGTSAQYRWPSATPPARTDTR